MKLKEIKKKAAEKLEKAKEFVKENKELVIAATLGAVGIGATIGTVHNIKKPVNPTGEAPDDDFDDDYYDREVEVNIDGIEHKCLYQYLGRDGAALWLDVGDKEGLKELDTHFREDSAD